MKCEICGAENPPSMNHTSMHTCICVDCCRDKKPEWQKRAEEAEVELAEARAEIERLKCCTNCGSRLWAATGKGNCKNCKDFSAWTSQNKAALAAEKGE